MSRQLPPSGARRTSGHPTLRAFLLVVGVLAVIVLLAAASTFGAR